ncbi:NAD(P)-dependent oxidoreductase [Paraburkholderia acidicola]|uniref:NAD(P)-dependent oxidoreductase n=1 Tax=Paraburkholderia acidicola TaxID=1912599 RepID=A0ABV1LEY6_9BURK
MTSYSNGVSNMETRVSFVGLGAMGWPMAANLVKAGYNVYVFDVSPDATRRFESEVGGRACTSLPGLGAAADVVITMLPTSKIVREVLLDEHGIAQTLRAGAVVIDMSSGVPGETVQIARDLAAKGIDLVDAPVSGGTRRAVTGELAIIVGGDEDVIDRVTPVLEAMGRSITRMGPVGSGQAMKALNNLALGGSFLIALEALLVGKKFGLDPALIVDVLNASSGMNYNTQTKFKQFLLSGTYAAGFSLDLLVKDIGIAVRLADELDADVPIASACKAIWTDALETLGTGHDHTEIARVVAQAIGVNFP